MRYFIFNYTSNIHLIDSFLESASLSHKQPKKTEEWFLWKFRDNPFGETIMACVEEDEKIVGCVAYGVQPFLLEGKKIKGVISFETFVHPEYQGKGVFGKLIKFAEQNIRNKKIDLMLNFPNTHSLNGFLKNGWSQIQNPEYWIKGNSIFSIPMSLKDIRQAFKPLPFNQKNFPIPDNFAQKPVSKLNSMVTSSYLYWRFSSYPVGEYLSVVNKNYFFVMRLGNRGNIREAQVLFLNIYDEKVFIFSDFIKECKLKIEYDIISFSISKYNPIRKYIKKALFIKVPNQTNACFKILNNDIIYDKDVRDISLSAINYHTY